MPELNSTQPSVQTSEQNQPPSPPPTYQRTDKKTFSWTKFFHNLGSVGSAMGKIFSFLFYLFLISAFLGAGGIFGGTDPNQGESLYGKGEEKVAVIDIAGLIIEQDNQSSVLGQAGVTTYRHVLKTLEKVANDPQVVAIVLRINSPGGSVTASEEMYQAITRYKQGIDIPVVASMGDTAASGGYYVALAADHIIADTSTLTGSIGVILQTVNFNQLAQEYGVESVTISSGPNKDLLNPLEPVNEQHTQILQSVVDQAYQQFTERILQNRPLTREELMPLADGRVLSGAQAHQAKLIDSVGSFPDATGKAAELAGVQDPQIVIYGQASFLDSLLGVLSSRVNLISYNPLDSISHLNSRPAYLFTP